MPSGFEASTTSLLVNKRGLIISTILFFNLFTLYFVIAYHIPQQAILSLENRFFAQALLHFTIAITLLLSSFFINRLGKLRLVYVSSAATGMATALLLFVSNELLRTAIIIVTGIFFSIGMLAIFVYFWSITLPEERGRIAGRIGLFSLPLYFLVDYLLAPSLDFSMIVALGVLLSLGPILTVFLRPEKVVRVSENNEMVNYPETRTILLYSIPWILFSLINSTIAKSTSLSVLEQTPASFYFSLTIIQGIGVIFGAICGGTIADYFGRRLSLAFGLTLYGMSSALAGLASGNVILISVYFSNGLSWGVLMIMYTFVIWGDLANKENCAKLYSIGLITFYLTMGIGLLLPVMIVPLVVSALTVCLLVFLANVPLILAKELLPSDIREKIKLKLHMKAVKKLSEKPQNQR